jgi:hypothetical protein
LRVLSLIMHNEHCSNDSNYNEREWEHKAWLRNTLGLIIVQDVIAFTDLCFQEARITLFTHLVSKLAEKPCKDTLSVPIWVLVGTCSHTLISVHDQSIITRKAVVTVLLALVTWKITWLARSVGLIVHILVQLVALFKLTAFFHTFVTVQVVSWLAGGANIRLAFTCGTDIITPITAFLAILSDLNCNSLRTHRVAFIIDCTK